MAMVQTRAVMHPVALGAEGPTEPAGTRTYLMCPPAHFTVSYRINPWMDPARPVDRHRAMRQWRRVQRAYRRAGHRVVLARAEPGLPDMVFAANAALVVDGRALLSRFRHPERRAEEQPWRRALAEAGVVDVAAARYASEGEGDYAPVDGVILGASGFRTDPRTHDQVAELFGRPVVGLELVDPRFYHLDTALTVLGTGVVAYWPEAFSPASQGALRDLFPEAVLAAEADAVGFGLNACSDGTRVVLSRQAPRLADAIAERGFEIEAVDTSELQLAGGSAKCTTLEVRP